MSILNSLNAHDNFKTVGLTLDRASAISKDNPDQSDRNTSKNNIEQTETSITVKAARHILSDASYATMIIVYLYGYNYISIYEFLLIHF
jgi:hypothetical protein